VVGEPPQLGFEPRDHLEIGTALDLIDMESAARVSGSRFAYLKGDLVFLEISGVVHRYGAALMRSVAIGKIDAEFERRNEIVHEVLATTMAAIRPGVTSGDVNSACAAAFARHGYTMLKRAGYSMGINFPPGWGEGDLLDLSAGSPVVLQPGMVFHIPQPYRMAGEQTVSVSETVLVTETSCESLTQFPRQLFRA